MNNEIESTRQQKIGRQILRDMSDIFSKEAAPLIKGTMVSVTRVRMSPDFSLAKVYLSIFPFERHPEVMKVLEENNWMIRKALGIRVKNQLRIVPELGIHPRRLARIHQRNRQTPQTIAHAAPLAAVRTEIPVLEKITLGDQCHFGGECGGSCRSGHGNGDPAVGVQRLRGTDPRHV